MNNIKTANAPCSWGALEFDLETEAPGYLQVLQEISETGYAGTELGDWGFMPTSPGALREEVAQFQLDLIGAFVPVALADEKSHEQGLEHALRTARLMYEAGYPEAFIVLADDNGAIAERTANAGRIKPEMGLDESRWKTFAKGAELIAKAVKEEYGMRTVFHHHCAGHVETPEELEMLMSLTDGELLGLCFDTGHYAYGGGEPLEALKKYKDRIWHVHFKDYDPHVGRLSQQNQWDYFESVKQGIFCELGKGSVDFQSVLNTLNEWEYKGWIVVEQDVLPGMGTPKECAQNNRVYLKKLGL